MKTVADRITLILDPWISIRKPIILRFGIESVRLVEVQVAIPVIENVDVVRDLVRSVLYEQAGK